MQTTLVAMMIQSHMRPDVGQLSVELAVLRHIYVCSDVSMSLSRCWWCIISRCGWCIIVGHDSIAGSVHIACISHLYRRCYSLICDLTKAN